MKKSELYKLIKELIKEQRGATNVTSQDTAVPQAIDIPGGDDEIEALDIRDTDDFALIEPEVTIGDAINDFITSFTGDVLDPSMGGDDPPVSLTDSGFFCDNPANFPDVGYVNTSLVDNLDASISPVDNGFCLGVNGNDSNLSGLLAYVPQIQCDGTGTYNDFITWLFTIETYVPPVWSVLGTVLSGLGIDENSFTGDSFASEFGGGDPDNGVFWNCCTADSIFNGEGEDGHCYQQGCMDETASNGDADYVYTGPVNAPYTELPDAENTALCIYETDVEGCGDSDAVNYDESVTVNDGSCNYEVIGCTDNSADNYYCLDPDDEFPCDENTSNGSVAQPGDTAALIGTDIGNAIVVVDTDPTSCIFTDDVEEVIIEDCTDPEAMNFNANADVDDGGCEYFEWCTDPAASNYYCTSYDEDYQAIVSAQQNAWWYSQQGVLECNQANEIPNEGVITNNDLCVYPTQIEVCTEEGAWNQFCTQTGAGIEGAVNDCFDPDNLPDGIELIAGDNSWCVFAGCNPQYETTQDLITQYGEDIEDVYGDNPGGTIGTVWNNNTFQPFDDTDDGCPDSSATGFGQRLNGYLNDDNISCCSYSDIILIGCDDPDAYNYYCNDGYTTNPNYPCVNIGGLDQPISNPLTAVTPIIQSIEDDGQCRYGPYCGNSLADNFYCIDESIPGDDNCPNEEIPSNVDIDDTLCTYTFDGCPSIDALNYYCLTPVEGFECTDIIGGSLVIPDNITVTQDTVICEFEPEEVPGCNDATAANFQPSATADDGSCWYNEGCANQDATNYYCDNVADALAIAGAPEGINVLEYDCEGGTFPAGFIENNDLCEFTEIGHCMELGAWNYNQAADGVNYNDDPAYTVVTDNSICQFAGCNPNTDNIPGDYTVDDLLGTIQFWNGSAIIDGIIDTDDGCPPLPGTTFGEGLLEVSNVSCCRLNGCTDSTAFNYNEFATQDDGTCYPVIYGCTNPDAFNYIEPVDDVMVDVNTDDGSCIGVTYGCTDPEADNDSFNPDANTDDGSCEYNGCTDPAADNYDETANVDDGTCFIFEEIPGCTDMYADNFDPDANMDDGSCEYTNLSCCDIVATQCNPELPEGASTQTFPCVAIQDANASGNIFVGNPDIFNELAYDGNLINYMQLQAGMQFIAPGTDSPLCFGADYSPFPDEDLFGSGPDQTYSGHYFSVNPTGNAVGICVPFFNQPLSNIPTVPGIFGAGPNSGGSSGWSSYGETNLDLPNDVPNTNTPVFLGGASGVNCNNWCWENQIVIYNYLDNGYDVHPGMAGDQLYADCSGQTNPGTIGDFIGDDENIDSGGSEGSEGFFDDNINFDGPFTPYFGDQDRDIGAGDPNIFTDQGISETKSLKQILKKILKEGPEDIPETSGTCLGLDPGEQCPSNQIDSPTACCCNGTLNGETVTNTCHPCCCPGATETGVSTNLDMNINDAVWTVESFSCGNPNLETIQLLPEGNCELGGGNINPGPSNVSVLRALRTLNQKRSQNKLKNDTERNIKNQLRFKKDQQKRKEREKNRRRNLREVKTSKKLRKSLLDLYKKY